MKIPFSKSSNLNQPNPQTRKQPQYGEGFSAIGKEKTRKKNRDKGGRREELKGFNLKVLI